MSTERSNKRIINVSNRLPVKISASHGKMVFQQSEGGLATGLSSVFSDSRNLWIGWPGAVVKDSEKAGVTSELEALSLAPVFLSNDEIRNYYEGFSNETLWPLFHYFLTYSRYDEAHWESYVSVNRKFADEVIKAATTDDIVWVHDYQLMLVPQMVREAIPDITIGYFQHIPFPDYEIFRALPWKAEIIQGLLGADTIGFQTDDDAQHFTATASRILGITAENGQIVKENRVVSVAAFPISIDFDKFHGLAMHTETEKNAAKICEMVKGKMALSIDRLDYSKGILQRLRAFDMFLAKHPEWHEKITLVHLVVPSRDNVSCYRDLKEEMDRLVTGINGRYATIGWQPIQHFYRSFCPNMLSALYKCADLALVTPLRDGMNLVSKEYVASNVSLNGVLLLGEAAGAAKELTDALIVNPNDTCAFADKIYEALNMDEDEKKSRMERMRAQVKNSNIFHWADAFMKKLRSTVSRQPLKVCMPVRADVAESIKASYFLARKRLLLLDYDGTLMPFFKKASDAYPDADLLLILNRLAEDERNDVVVISGRDMETLEKWLGHLKIEMVGEHGAWFREQGKAWYSVGGLDSGWKDEVRQIFDAYSLLTPGTSSEEKTHSIAWHYRAADNRRGEQNAAKMVEELAEKFRDKGLDILMGSKVIEVKSSKVNKGKAAVKLIDREKYDFIMVIGDDRTDEDMFRVVPENAVSVKVGSNISAATYWQNSYVEVRGLLRSLIPSGVKLSGKVIQLLVTKAS